MQKKRIDRGEIWFYLAIATVMAIIIMTMGYYVVTLTHLIFPY